MIQVLHCSKQRTRWNQAPPLPQCFVRTRLRSYVGPGDSVYYSTGYPVARRLQLRLVRLENNWGSVFRRLIYDATLATPKATSSYNWCLHTAGALRYIARRAMKRFRYNSSAGASQHGVLKPNRGTDID